MGKWLKVQVLQSRIEGQGFRFKALWFVDEGQG
jgi:hypothetical protein